MAMEEIAFPRGGQTSRKKETTSSSTNEKEKRSNRKRKQSNNGESTTENRPSSEFLFGGGSKDTTKKSAKSESGGSAKKKQKTDSSVGNRSMLPIGGGGVVIPAVSKKKTTSKTNASSSSTAPLIEALGFSKLSKGTKVLGCVREVHDEFAIISLPNQLTGYILLKDMNSAAASAFSSPNGTPISSLRYCLATEQILTVVVQKVVTEKLAGGVEKRRIQLSASPLHVNPRDQNKDTNNGKSLVAGNTTRGQILSVEDHGCLVDLGLGRKGFLKFSNVEGGKYTVLEGDEEEPEDQDTTKGGKKVILQRGRLYDFVHLTTKPSDDSKADKDAEAPSIIQLKLPSLVKLSQQVVLPPASKHSASHTLHTLQPGMLVTAKVEALARNGLCVTFLGGVFRGSVELGSHMGGHYREEKWRQVFDKHQHFPARIIAIDTATKLIRLSIAPHILQLKASLLGEGPNSSTFPPVGTTVENCTVVRVDAGIGALLALPEKYHVNAEKLLPKSLANKSDLFKNEVFQEAMSVPAVYVHISKAYDDNAKKGKKKSNDREVNAGRFGKDFSLGSTHSVRILSNSHWIDGVAAGGSAPSILGAHVLTHSDLQPGQVYKQVPVCMRLEGGSVLVNLGGSAGNQVRGLIPSPIHLMDSKTNKNSEFRRKVLETKFAVDAKVDVRVLWVDHIKKKCVVTAKKSLVKVDESQVVTSFDQLKLGQTATGFVSKLDDRSLYVTFCNRVYGRVTAKSLASELGVENHKENYQIGDVVTCRVVKISENLSKKRPQTLEPEDEDEEMDIDATDEKGTTSRVFYEVLLSLKVEGSIDDSIVGDETENDIKIQTQKIHVKAGAILPLKALKIVELVPGKARAKGTGFVPGYAIVSIKSKYLIDEPEKARMLPQMECKLPYDQLLDEYHSEDIESAEALDALATRVLKVGKKINQKAIVLTDPHKSNVDHSSGIGRLTVVSLRKSLIETMEAQANSDNDEDIRIPCPTSDLFVGALVKGYVAQIDPRHGAFLRFLDGMTGLIPRSNNGLALTPYSTVLAKVQVVDDTVRPAKIMLQPVGGKNKDLTELPFKVGDIIATAKIVKIQLLHTTLDVDSSLIESNKNVLFQLHATMKEAPHGSVKISKKSVQAKKISKGHPFYGLNINDELNDLTVVSVSRRHGKVIVQVTDRKIINSVAEDAALPPTYIDNQSQLRAGMSVAAVVKDIREDNKGLEVLVSPTVRGFIPSLELSTDLRLLNALSDHIAVGTRLQCVVMDKSQWHENRARLPFASETQKRWLKQNGNLEGAQALFLSVLAVTEPTLAFTKPGRNDLVLGRINKSLPQLHAPSLMLSLRGGFVARCCITELTEPDDWENMPLGRFSDRPRLPKSEKTEDKQVAMDEDSDEESDSDEGDKEEHGAFPDGKYVQCRVLRAIPKQSIVEVSLRRSRIEGDIDDDEPPPEGETVQAFVIQTNKKGCFVRLGRHIEGRTTIKELSDGFLPDPPSSFPMGRLVVGKVKAVQPCPKKSKNNKDQIKFQVDLDMRESVVLEHKKPLAFEDVELQSKYKGTVTRVESYGVFVKLENSNVSGLVHMSECSDKFIKNLQALYNPGDLVKVLVIKKDEEGKKLGFSMKASHFENDDDSDDDDSSIEDEEMLDASENLDEGWNGDDLDSDDDNFASKLASKMNEGDSDDEEESESEDSEASEEAEEDSDDSGNEKSSEEEQEHTTAHIGMDSNVGFDWASGNGTAKQGKSNDPDDSSDESDSDDSDEEEENKASSHKSRKKQAQRRREEQEISRREVALADGTADDNPETAGDFERLLAGEPNSSELWIRYMAFHLSLADISKARLVAERALERIEFQEEREKLNVWSALLTLEHKYGDEESLQKTIDRACGQNNPKKVYLRVCEILEKDLTSPGAISRADDMHSKMRKKFKAKKKVWLASLQYLLKQSRHQEAHALLKRALLSLPSHKHAETMSKFAQLEFEFGSAERARTLFGGILAKYPKRLDLFFVYLDKEVKFGSMKAARLLLEGKVDEAKLSDKQMKSLFKKWYRIEEQHGTDETLEHVKESARKYVERAST